MTLLSKPGKIKYLPRAIPRSVSSATFSAERSPPAPEISFVSKGFNAASSRSEGVSVSGGNTIETRTPRGFNSERNTSEYPRNANFVGAYAA